MMLPQKWFTGHRSSVSAMLEQGDILWSLANNLRRWDIKTGTCIQSIEILSVRLAFWNGYMALNCYNNGVGLIHLINQDGTMSEKRWPAETGQSSVCLATWDNWLCTGGSGVISVFKDVQVPLFELKHNGWLKQLMVVKSFLFANCSGYGIKKWNQQGECVCEIKDAMVGKYLAVSSQSIFLRGYARISKFDFDGEFITSCVIYEDDPKALVTWRGGLLGISGNDNVVVIWSFRKWNTSNHREFDTDTKQCIKTMMLVSHSPLFPTSITKDILFIIFAYYARTTTDINIE